ncbi:MAG: hypothetical protein CVU05_09865 [Bacteroidetes bacterium HGW-Bacteroidetes-21]|jgi:GNAT superfamily N-acetyltransferase|nr:MAG: hypothetical protein CVU05_09865 [Bacteroidetes bacterium HGW-Bacteroidetes-21]
MKTIEIKAFRKGMETVIYQLIKKVYDDFVAVDYSDNGNLFFYNWIQPSKIALRQEIQNNLWVAYDEKRMVGMIEIRENKNISLLFVDKEYQGQGIARMLFQVALNISFERDPCLKTYYVHASPFSIPIYEKLGFVAQDEMKIEHGIKYLPMEMQL